MTSGLFDGENPPKDLEEVIFQALGAASTCWEDMSGTGVFDSNRAKSLGDDVIHWIRNHYSSWRWLESTRELQVKFFGLDYDALTGDALGDYFMAMTIAAQCELIEFLEETNWKPWMHHDRGVISDRDAAIGELVDAAHFLGNILCALDVTDEEWEDLYQKKQERNRRRRESGSYTKEKYKCPDCGRELDKPGAILEDTYAKLFLCAHCSAKIDVTHRCNQCGLIEPKVRNIDGRSHCDNCGHAL